MNQKKAISITLDEELVEEVKYEAEKSGRSFSNYVNAILTAKIRRVRRAEERE